MTRAFRFATCCASLLCAFGCAFGAAEGNAARQMAAGYLRMEIANRAVSEARMLAGGDEALCAEVQAAANDYRGSIADAVKTQLSALFPDRNVAMKSFGDFVNRYITATTGGDPASLAALAKELDVDPAPKDAAALTSYLMKHDLDSDVSAAGEFLGDVQAWLSLRKKGDVPPLSAWLSRDRPCGKVSEASAGETAKRKPKKKRRNANPLRESEAPAGEFVEAKDDGGSSLRSFGSMRRERRKKAMEDAKLGMAQVAAERKTADDEANAKKLAAAQAEAAALQAQAQRLAAAEQEAVVQEQNSWRTRIRGVLTTAIGAAGGAFAGSIGNRVGEAAANAVLNPR